MARFLAGTASQRTGSQRGTQSKQQSLLHARTAPPPHWRTAQPPLRTLASAAQPKLAPQPAELSDAISARVAMLGAGNMGGAMVKGWIKSGIASPAQLAACCRAEENAVSWDNLGLQVFGDVLDSDEAAALAEFADIIFLGIKPQYLAPALESLSPHLEPRHTIVSIAAGWTMAQLEAALPEGTAVLRVMPNTPILVGQGACVFCAGTHANEEDREVVQALLSSCGMALEVQENMIDAVIGVSGSGPAYMFQVLEAMADGGVRAGLPRKQALMLAAQTMKGAAEMVLNPASEDIEDLHHPGVLKDQVTSPGGTTITALSVLEEEGVRSAFIKAVGAAASQSKKMSEGR